MFSATLTVKHESTGQSYQLKVSSLRSVLELVEGFQGIIEEEYNMLKEHVTLDELSGYLQAKYPFKKDPVILTDNSKEAKACQVSQEKRQLRNNIHSQYVKQFTDMLDIGVIS